MSDMLKTFVKKELDRQVQEKYPHMAHPPGLCAKVKKVREAEEKRICTLRLLDKDLNEDPDFPELPDVKTEMEVQEGDTVAILRLYGGDSVFIMGRYEA